MIFVADFLSPTHHGQGVMTAVMGTLMNEWCIPRMGMRHVRTAIFVGNEGSRRVMEKNGFALWKTVEGCIDVPAKGEYPAERKSLEFMEWRM